MDALIGIRPDLSNAVRVLSQHVSEPGKQHCLGVKLVLRYRDSGLRFAIQGDQCCRSKVNFQLRVSIGSSMVSRRSKDQSASRLLLFHQLRLNM